MKIDKKIIKQLSDYLKEFNLTEIEITEKDTKIKVSKNNSNLRDNFKSIEEKIYKFVIYNHLLPYIDNVLASLAVCKGLNVIDKIKSNFF